MHFTSSSLALVALTIVLAPALLSLPGAGATRETDMCDKKHPCNRDDDSDISAECYIRDTNSMRPNPASIKHTFNSNDCFWNYVCNNPDERDHWTWCHPKACQKGVPCTRD